MNDTQTIAITGPVVTVDLVVSLAFLAQYGADVSSIVGSAQFAAAAVLRDADTSALIAAGRLIDAVSVVPGVYFVPYLDIDGGETYQGSGGDSYVVLLSNIRARDVRVIP